MLPHITIKIDRVGPDSAFWIVSDNREGVENQYQTLPRQPSRALEAAGFRLRYFESLGSTVSVLREGLDYLSETRAASLLPG